MTLEFICNGYHTNGYQEATYTIEISVEKVCAKHFKHLFENKKLTAAYSNETINITLHNLSWFNGYVFKEVTAINEKHKYIYLVMLEWLTEDDAGLDYYLYKSYTDAKDKYERLIEDENDADISWIGSKVFDENGEVNEGFNFECSKETNEEKNLCWKVTDTNSKNRYSIITLTKVEIL